MATSGVNRRIREAIAAGIFYPDDKSALTDSVDRALGQVDRASSSGESVQPITILSPHAAFQYSGAVQAAAWFAAAGKTINRVVIIAPLRQPGESAAYLPEADVFQTPLGDIEIDAGACADLESCNTLFSANDIPHFDSHAIEVQLPFMRRLFPGALLVPVLIGGDARVAASLALAIDMVLGDDMDRTLVVASSNLASSLISADAELRSDEMLASMETGNWRLVAGHRETPGSLAVAVAMALGAMQGARYRLLARLDSGRCRATPTERIVHYGAVAWYQGGVA